MENITLPKNEYLKLEAKLSEYNKMYKSKHPRMIRLNEEIDELVKRIEGVKIIDFNYGLSQDTLIGDHATKSVFF